jgi:hypothetical protein
MSPKKHAAERPADRAGPVRVVKLPCPRLALSRQPGHDRGVEYGYQPLALKHRSFSRASSAPEGDGNFETVRTPIGASTSPRADVRQSSPRMSVQAVQASTVRSAAAPDLTCARPALSRRWPGRWAILALLAALALGCCHPASAGLADEQALAERYAPVVRLVEQPEECGPGEPYEPMNVDVLFDEPTVALRGPWNPGDLVKIAPSASDLARGLYEYHLDFPGNALDPGCEYERWSRRLTDVSQATVYAHVATDPTYPGQLALQYWLFYAYNDWNNLHEGDWEMIQLDFDAADARQALARQPKEVGYSQHEGAEKADWGDEKLEILGGTHPVVHPAAGSHANFFDEGLYLGSSAEQGVGCDDTTGPTFDLRPVVETIPSSPALAEATFPWIAFQGRWGELQRAFYNGPTGPNLKRQWTTPIQTSRDWRDRSYAVPGGGALGTGATDFFCAAVSRGSLALVRLVAAPLLVLVLAAAVLLLLLLFGLTRLKWQPAAPLRVARRRAGGQVLAAAARMYARRAPLFLGIGVVAVPISILVTLLQVGVLSASSLARIDTEGESGGVLVTAVVAIGTTLTLFTLGLVQAAVIRTLIEIDAGRKVGPLQAYRLGAGRSGRLVGALALAVVLVSLLGTSVFLLPVAVWLAVRWALVAPVVAVERAGPFEALQRSGRLVRPQWLKVGAITLIGTVLALATGPLVGALIIVLTDAPLSLVNAVTGLLGAVTMPFLGLATAYLYFDARTRDELELTDARRPRELPAETELPL